MIKELENVQSNRQTIYNAVVDFVIKKYSPDFNLNKDSTKCHKKVRRLVYEYINNSKVSVCVQNWNNKFILFFFYDCKKLDDDELIRVDFYLDIQKIVRIAKLKSIV